MGHGPPGPAKGGLELGAYASEHNPRQPHESIPLKPRGAQRPPPGTERGPPLGTERGPWATALRGLQKKGQNVRTQNRGDCFWGNSLADSPALTFLAQTRTRRRRVIGGEGRRPSGSGCPRAGGAEEGGARSHTVSAHPRGSSEDDQAPFGNCNYGTGDATPSYFWKQGRECKECQVAGAHSPLRIPRFPAFSHRGIQWAMRGASAQCAFPHREE